MNKETNKYKGGGEMSHDEETQKSVKDEAIYRALTELEAALESALQEVRNALVEMKAKE